MMMKQSFCNPPLSAALFFVACICFPIVQTQILKNQLIYKTMFVPFQSISKATSPIVLLILGSTLYEIYLRKEKFGKYLVILKIIFNRLLLMPIIGMIVVKFVQCQKLIGDKGQLFMLFLTFCTPSSIILFAKQYLQSIEEILSLILLSIITLPLWMIIYLMIFME